MSNIPGKAYFQQRQRNRVYEAVIRAVETAGAKGMKRKDIARITGKSPSQVSHWLSGPSNWSLDSISDILFSVGSEMNFSVSGFSEVAKSNIFHPLDAASAGGAIMITQTKASAPRALVHVAVR